jgi:dihydroorotate dehydrogenase
VTAYGLLRPLLFRLPPETAHRLALRALAHRPAAAPAPAGTASLRQRLLGLDFANPIGLAAGFDKNAEAPDGCLGLGFGFVEVGTVTPRPQPGNPRPRLFRLPADRALINRLGFNNDGHEAAYRRLAARPRQGIVGVNVGANKDSPDRIGDYAAGIRRFAGVADYLTVNISSPNTPGLRDLQERQALTALLERIAEARAAGPAVPILVKIAPDLDEDALAGIAEAVLAAGMDGIVATNTTTARDGLADTRHAAEAGGLSGRPLYRRSTALLARLRQLVGRRLVLVGVGGIDSTETALGKLAAGADLVQLYTGLVYEGPRLPARIAAGMARRLAEAGIGSVAALVGRALGEGTG